MKSAIDWIVDDLPAPNIALIQDRVHIPTSSSASDEYEVFYQKLTEIAIRNIAFEEEILSHLSAIQEVNRREQVARDTRAHIILDRLEKIEEKIGHVTNGGLKEAMQDLVPIILRNAGAIQAENAKGRWSAKTAAISGTFAVLGGLITWMITKFL
jgi:hypothetical protein